jgi:hypothetical protein
MIVKTSSLHRLRYSIGPARITALLEIYTLLSPLIVHGNPIKIKIHLDNHVNKDNTYASVLDSKATKLREPLEQTSYHSHGVTDETSIHK